jgi:hypothetical protein
MLSCFRSLWSHVVEWSPDILPAISNLILVLLGIIMSLPVLAENIEKTPRYRKGLAVVCLVFGLTGFIFDVVQRHSTEKTTTQLLGNTSIMVGNTNDLVQTTKAMVTTVSVLMPKLNAVQGEIATLEIQIRAAREKHDPKLLADLEAKMKQAKDQADRMTRELHSLTMAPQVAQQLREWYGTKEQKIRDLHNGQWEENTHWREEHPNDSDGRNKAWNEWDDRIEKEGQNSDEQLTRMLANADLIRKEMLQLIPPQQQSAEDKKQEKEFLQTDSDQRSLEKAARYVEERARRVPPPK